MSKLQRVPMTPEEFLAWEARQDRKWEFDGSRPVAKNGETYGHSVIQGNVISALRQRLAGGPCRPCGPDMRVPTVPGHYRYPDALVTCEPPDRKAVEVSNPVLVLEILSASTAANDRTTKLAEYQAMPTVRRCILLEQDRAFATVLTRTERGWDHALLGPQGILALPEIGIELPISAFYEGVVFEPEEEPADR